MIEKIDHIGIAVKDLNEAALFYKEILGLELSSVEEVESQGVKVGFIQIGESNVELLEGTNENGSINKFIEKRGEGVHHIAFKVESIDDVLKILVEKGVRLIDEKPREGAGGKKIAFLHPKSTNGVLIEICEG